MATTFTTASAIGTLTELRADTIGYWADFLSIDRTIIENQFCPKCGTNLVYKGFSKPEHYKAFGICSRCDFAKLFWTKPAVLARGKKKFSVPAK